MHSALLVCVCHITLIRAFKFLSLFLDLAIDGLVDLLLCCNAVPLYLVVVDLKAAKDTIRILTALQEAYPVAKNALEQRLQELLGIVNGALIERVRHAMADGDARAIGWVCVT